jgi:hypothetical protein
LRLKFLGAAMVLSTALVGPAMAQHVNSRISTQAACQNRDAGNPYDPQRDFEQWSAWREQGSWDSRNDCWSGASQPRRSARF